METDGETPQKPNKKRQLKKLVAVVEKTLTSFKKLKAVILVRNGERCDRVFPEWLSVNVNDAGQYEPNDLNMPYTLFERPEGPSGYVDDSPITEVGSTTSRIVGRALRVCPIWPIHRIYCSPALRSVQSAVDVAKGMKKPVEICVEPALYDFLGWYKTMPSLLAITDLQRFHLPVYAEYNTLMSVEELKPLVGQESIETFYSRIHSAIGNIINKENSTEHIVIVTHAPVIDAAIKSLRMCPPKMITEMEMLHMGTFYPYCSTVAMAKPQNCSLDANKRIIENEKFQEWSFVFDPIPPLSYLGISNRVDAHFIERTTAPQIAAIEDLKQK